MKSNTSHTVDKALKILESFLENGPDIGIGDLARITGLNVSTSHRIASTLVKRGYLEHPYRAGKYRLGLQLLKLGNAVKAQVIRSEVILPTLRKLNEITGESVNLVVQHNHDAVYIEHIEAKHFLRTFAEAGNRVPLYCTGVGKVLLAFMKENEFENYMSTEILRANTKTTIVNPDELRREMTDIRRNGLAVDNGELEEGTRCLAAPIKDSKGSVVAAVSISGPSSRLTSVRLKELDPVLRRYALEASRLCGFDVVHHPRIADERKTAC